MLIQQVDAYLPLINFDGPGYQIGPLGGTGANGWNLLSGRANITPPGQGTAHSRGLSLPPNAQIEPHILRSIPWPVEEPVAFIDMMFKPAANPEGSMASISVNGSQIAFQVSSGASYGDIWVYNGSPGPDEQPIWLKTAATFPLSPDRTQAQDFLRLTLRQDYNMTTAGNRWDLYINEKLVAANLHYEGRGGNLTQLEIFGSKLGETLLDDLSVTPQNPLFTDADQDGLPDAWEAANGGNITTNDRNLPTGTAGETILDRYLNSLATPSVNGASATPPSAGIPPLSIFGAHQPVTALKGALTIGGNGAATYSMPIDIPQGTAGMEPAISLDYSSSANNGIAGVGWSLAGLHTITRGPASVQKDGFAGAVTYSNSDRFFFNGERLVCINGTNGAENSEYRTELESYARFRLMGGNQNSPNSWWKVETKSGITLEIGRSSDSKTMAPYGRGPILWDISRATDVAKNYYTVSWKSFESGNRFVDTISYTGNENKAMAPYCHLVFNYQARPDARSGFDSSGLPTANTKRLSNIEVKTGSQINHTYILAYETSHQTGRSLLKSVIKQAPGGATTSPTVFNYQGLKAGEAKWKPANQPGVHQYGGDRMDANNKEINSLSATTANSIRLEGDAARHVDLNPHLRVGHGMKMEFTIKTKNANRGVYLILDNDGWFHNDSEFCIRVRDVMFPGSANMSTEREVVYNPSPGSGGWQTFRIDFQDHWNWRLNRYHNSYSTLAFINDVNTAEHGSSTTEIKDIRFGTTEQLDQQSVPTLQFPETFHLPKFSTNDDDNRDLRILDVNSDGLPDFTDYQISDWRSRNRIVPASERGVSGGVYLNDGTSFRSSPRHVPPADAPFANGSELTAQRHNLAAIPCDFNSDGLTDLFVTKIKSGHDPRHTSVHSYHFYSYIAGAWVEQTSATLPFISKNYRKEYYGGNMHLTLKQLTDVDQDGYPDLIVQTSDAGWLEAPGSTAIWPHAGTLLHNSKGTVFLNRLHTGGGWVQQDSLAPPNLLGHRDDNTIEAQHNTLADLNGDGFLDYAYANAHRPNDSQWSDHRETRRLYPPTQRGQFPSWLSNSDDPLNPRKISAWNLPEAPYPVHMESRRSGSGRGSYTYWYSELERPNHTHVNGSAILDGEDQEGTYLLDVNGDGLTDVLRASTRHFDNVTRIGRGYKTTSCAEVSHSVWLNRGYVDHIVNGSAWRWQRVDDYTPPRSLCIRLNEWGSKKSHEFADLNGDGLVDILHLTHSRDYFGPNGNYRASDADPLGADGQGAFINTGTGWTSDKSWRLPDGGTFSNQDDHQQDLILADVNGDGFPDIIGNIRHGGQPKLWLNQCQPEVLTSVVDGFGAHLGIEYKRMNDPSVGGAFQSRIYTPAPAPASNTSNPVPPGQARIIDARLLVSRYTEQNGLGGIRSRSQRYGDMRYDVTNQVSLGFGWVEAIDELNCQVTRTEFSQEFPSMGSPLTITSSVCLTQDAIDNMPPNGPGSGAFTPSDRIVLSEEVATYGQLPQRIGTDGAIIYSPVQTRSVKTLYGLAGDIKGKTTTTQNLSDFDSYGFVTNSTVQSLDGKTITTVNHYNHPVTADKWHLGRLSSSTVTKSYSQTQGSGTNTQTTVKTSTFKYDLGTGMLKSETIEPSHPLSVTTTYSHDGFGNILETTVSSSGQDRRSASTYDLHGRFVTATTNDKGYTTTANYDFASALLLSTTDISGLTTRFSYDAFGTQILTHLPDGTSQASITGYATSQSIPATIASQLTGEIRWFRATQSSGSPPAFVYLDALGRELVTETTVFRDNQATGSARYSKVYTFTRYDAQGRKIAISEPMGAADPILLTTIQYDVLSRATATVRPGGVEDHVLSQGSSPLNGQPTTYTKANNAAGQTLERWEDQHGRLIQSKDPSGQITSFTYDLENRLVTTSIDGREILRNTFDTFGNKTAVWEANSGESTTIHNGFGEVLSSTSATGETTHTTYDTLGRPDTVTKPEGTYTYTYYETQDVRLGQPKEILGGGLAAGYSETFDYDDLGRPDSTKRTQNGETFTTSTHYDALGRVVSTTDAGGLKVLTEYDPLYSFPVRKLIDLDSTEGGGTTLWEAGEYDAKGRETLSKKAFGVESTTGYHPERGDVTQLHTKQNSTQLQKLGYQWDNLGNLTERNDQLANIEESFDYDHLNRLERSEVVQLGGSASTIPPPQDYIYDKRGNLTQKGSSATLDYYGFHSGNRPYAVHSATVKGFARTYVYDAAGYVTSDGKRSYEWTSFGQLARLTYPSAPALHNTSGSIVQAPGHIESTFTFDASGNRSAQTKTRTGLDGAIATEYTTYVGSYEREIHRSQSPSELQPKWDKTVHRHSLGAGLVYTRSLKSGQSTAKTTLALVLVDHLGSTDLIVSRTWNGSTFTSQTIENQSFDAWGERRNPKNYTHYRSSDSQPFHTSTAEYDRGYTGQEQLDDSGLIHMNGRIYDPELGRFLSPDPVVQIPDYSQNFNRYSYVLNNPLNATDPSGFSFLGKIFGKIGDFIKENWRTIVSIVVVAVLTFVLTPIGGVGMNLLGQVSINSLAAQGAIVGSLSGGINSAMHGGSVGDILKSAVTGAVQGAITAGYLHDAGITAESANFFSLETAKHIAGHGIVGGVANLAMGGTFQDGFLSAAVSAAAANAGAFDFIKGDGAGSILGRTAVAGIVGGTASVLGGGKFANGAYTAAFQHLLNAEISRKFDVEGEFDIKKSKLSIRVFKDGKVYSFSLTADSGGEYGSSVGDFAADGSALPKGDYYLVKDPNNRKDWFGLFYADQRVDDYKMNQYFGNGPRKAVAFGLNPRIGKKNLFGRGNFRMHPGTRSTGCITCFIGDAGLMKAYSAMAAAISGSRTSQVRVFSGQEFPTINSYGIISVR